MPRYSPIPSGGGPGLNEYNLHQATGLRNAALTAVITSSPWGTASGGTLATWGSVVPNTDGTNITPIGNADGSRMNSFPTVGLKAASTAWNGVLPVPMTPTLLFLVLPAAATWPQTVEVRIRMQGRDQFGNPIEEITPWVTKVMTVTSQTFMVHMSKVFAVIDDCWIATSNISSAGALSQVGIGWLTCVDPTKAQAAAWTAANGVLAWGQVAGVQANGIWSTLVGATTSDRIDFCGTAANWGLGTPHQVMPFGSDMPYPSPEIQGCTVTLLRQRTTPTVIMNTQRANARGQLTVSGAAATAGVALGRNAAGWQGTPHKLCFFSNDNWATNAISGIDLGGSSLRASGTPVSYAQVGEDELMVNALLRTSFGTRRASSAERAYPNG